jgi:hypothetical protein
MFAIQSSSTPAPSGGSFAEAYLGGERIRSSERASLRDYSARMAALAENARQFNVQEARIRNTQAQANRNAQAAMRNKRLADVADFNAQAKEASKTGMNEYEAEDKVNSIISGLNSTSGYERNAVPQLTQAPMSQSAQQKAPQQQSVNLTGSSDQMNLTSTQPQRAVQNLTTKKDEEEDLMAYRTTPFIETGFDWGMLPNINVK